MVVQVQQQPGGAGIAVARLPDAPGIEQPFAAGHVELGALTARFARCRLTLVAHERRGDVGVADQANAVGLGVQAQLGEQRREHVLPHRVSRARVVEAECALLALRAQTLEEREVGGGDHLARPLRREARAAREIVQRQLADDRHVVVAREAHGGMTAHKLDAGVRVGAVADEIAQAPQLGGLAVGDRLQHGFECLSV